MAGAGRSPFGAPHDLDPGVIGTRRRLLLRSPRFAREHRPEVVLQLGERGRPRWSTGQLSAAVDAGAAAIVVDPWGRWTDPERRWPRSSEPTRRRSARRWRG